MNLSLVNFSIGDIRDRLIQLDPLNSDLYSICDEITYGRLFADVFSEIARFNKDAKCWFIYNGVIWEKDDSGVIAGQLAQKLARALRFYVALATGEELTDFEKAYVSFANKLGDRSKRMKMVKDAQELSFFSNAELDRQKNLLNCQNCVIDLTTGKVIEHDSELLLSKVCDVAYKPEASSEKWERFISEVMEGDKQKIEYLQRILGYGMWGDNPEEELYFCFGSTTRNGKSTCLETISKMLGTYAMNLSPDSIAVRKTDSRSASGDIARLAGCRFLHCSEPSKRMNLDVALVKTLLGRDSITARNLYEREFEFTPVFKLFINTNYLPVVNDDTLFSSGRVKVIEFGKHFTEAEQNTSLKRELMEPDVLSGVLNWCLKGFRQYRKIGTAPPDPVNLATMHYREQSDKFKRFVDECLEESSERAVQAKIVYTVYQKWCRVNGHGCENKSNFFTELRNRNLLSDTGTVNGVTMRNVIRGYFVPNEVMEELDSQRHI